MINVDTKLTLTTSGVWTKYNGTKFLVAHMSALPFQRKLARLQQPFRSKMEKGTIDPKLQRDLICEAMAGTVLLDWTDVVNSAGEQVAFSEELANQVLVNQQDVRDFISEFAINLDNFREESLNEMGK